MRWIAFFTVFLLSLPVVAQVREELPILYGATSCAVGGFSSYQEEIRIQFGAFHNLDNARNHAESFANFGIRAETMQTFTPAYLRNQCEDCFEIYVVVSLPFSSFPDAEATCNALGERHNIDCFVQRWRTGGHHPL